MARKKTIKAINPLRQEINDVAAEMGLPASFISKVVRGGSEEQRDEVRNLQEQLREAKAALRDGPIGSVKSLVYAHLGLPPIKRRRATKKG